MAEQCEIILYGLSTCPHCRKAKAYLENKSLQFECIYVDKLEGKEREDVMEKVKDHNPRFSFPTMVFYDDGDEYGADSIVVVGFKEKEIDEALQKKGSHGPSAAGTQEEALRKPNAEALYDTLRPLQESKGYYFNPDKAFTLEILGQLLEIKDRYGYMACPCRLSSGVREKDKDIICPCEYRPEDVKEYDSCFCGLYVSKEVSDGLRKKGVVPERRPVAKIFA